MTDEGTDGQNRVPYFLWPHWLRGLLKAKLNFYRIEINAGRIAFRKEEEEDDLHKTW